MSDHRDTRTSPLEMDPEEFRKAGHDLVDAIAELLERLPAGPVTPDASPAALRELLPGPELPEHGEGAGPLLRETAELLFEHSLFNGHPRFLGYITSAPAPIGALADLLAAAVNPNLGGWQLSPVATEIERQAVGWVADLLGYPLDCGGLFVSGGNVANFLCFLAAREAKAPWSFREQGIRGGEGDLLLYASTETHTWLHKAANLFGHGPQVVRPLPVDSEQRADVSTLVRTIEADRAQGHHPFLIVGTAGTVSTGAIDPLRAMREIADEQDLWFHVDGAYGAPAAGLADADPDLKALAGADSVAIDPHKWLYAPLEAGCALVRDPQALPAAFAYRPPYYHFTDEEADPRVNFYEYGLQNSRGFRALKVWLGLRQAGREGLLRMIGDDIRLAEAIHGAFDRHPECEARTLGLSIATFRYVPDGLPADGARRETYLDRLNEKLLERIKASGEAFLSNAVVDGRFLLRACVVNFRTTRADVEALPGIVVRHGRAVRGELAADDDPALDERSGFAQE